MESKLAFVRQPDSIPRKTAFSLRCFAAMPEQIQSPEMTADWETKLLQIERSEMEPETFMTEIKEMISSLVTTTEVAKERMRL